MDSTYLTATLAQLKLHNKIGLAGGVFTFEDPGSAFVPLTEDMDSTSIRKASQMLEFCCWNPSARKKTPLSLCAMPMETNWGGPMSSYKANPYMLRLIGEFLKQSDGLILGIVFDAASQHQYLKKILFGQPCELPESEIQQLPWFSEIMHEPIVHPLPRLPVALCYHQSESFWCLTGSCYLVVVCSYQFEIF